MSVLLYFENRFVILFRLNKFVISFRLIELVFFPFCIQKRCSCNPTLLFAKAVGLEVYKRGISIMLVSKVTIVVGAWVFCSLTRHARLFIPTNLATNFNLRKRSDAATVSKKGGIYTFISPRVRSDRLRLLGSNVTGDQREDSETTLVFARTPSLGF